MTYNEEKNQSNQTNPVVIQVLELADQNAEPHRIITFYMCTEVEEKLKMSISHVEKILKRLKITVLEMKIIISEILMAD